MGDNSAIATLHEILNEGSLVETDKCEFIQVDKNDAEFIFNLRKNHNASFLKVSGDKIQDQKKYLINYKSNFLLGREVYYKVRNKKADQFEAVVRLTQLNKDKVFSWESIISIPGGDPTTPIEIMLTIYKIGFELLGRETCGPWDVNNQHLSMQKIHKLVGMAKPISFGKTYTKYSVVKADFDKKKTKFNNLGFASNVRVSR